MPKSLRTVLAQEGLVPQKTATDYRAERKLTDALDALSQEIWEHFDLGALREDQKAESLRIMRKEIDGAVEQWWQQFVLEQNSD